MQEEQLLKKSVKIKSLLFKSFSHELRTPLQFSLGILECNLKINFKFNIKKKKKVKFNIIIIFFENYFLFSDFKFK